MGILRLVAFDKLARFIKIVRVNGGLFKSFGKKWRMDTLKEGTLKGTDEMGNKYFDNPRYMIGRSRWVEYNPKVNWDYDATQVTPEWFGWLHYKTDRLPSEDCAKLCLKTCSAYSAWLMPHQENMSGTTLAYYPYSTVRPHIYTWDGSSLNKRPKC